MSAGAPGANREAKKPNGPRHQPERIVRRIDESGSVTPAPPAPAASAPYRGEPRGEGGVVPDEGFGHAVLVGEVHGDDPQPVPGAAVA